MNENDERYFFDHAAKFGGVCYKSFMLYATHVICTPQETDIMKETLKYMGIVNLYWFRESHSLIQRQNEGEYRVKGYLSVTDGELERSKTPESLDI